MSQVLVQSFSDRQDPVATPGLHNKIPALKIFARGWVAQESIFLHYQR